MFNESTMTVYANYRVSNHSGLSSSGRECRVMSSNINRSAADTEDIVLSEIPFGNSDTYNYFHQYDYCSNISIELTQYTE